MFLHTHTEMKALKILSIDDADLKTQHQIKRHLGVTCDVEIIRTFKDGLSRLRETLFDALLLDMHLQAENLLGIDLIPQLRTEFPNLAILIVTHDDNYNYIYKAFQKGASDYVVKSDNLVADLQLRIPHAISLIRNSQIVEYLPSIYKNMDVCPLVGSAKFLSDLNYYVNALRGKPTPILIESEEWCGAESIAYKFWANEGESSRPFLQLNLSNISAEESECELFGLHTGVRLQKGALLLADGGDLFIQGIEKLSLPAQEKLHRYFESSVFEPVGSNSVVRANTRIICSSSKELYKEVQNGRFHEKLLKLLLTNPIKIPNFSKRKQDIPQIVFSYLKSIRNLNLDITRDALHYLSTHDWPGNFSQLKGVIDASIMSTIARNKQVIDVSDIFLPNCLNQIYSNGKKIDILVPSNLSDITKEGYEKCLYLSEKLYLTNALKLCEWDIKACADMIGISNTSLYRKIELLKITREDTIRLKLEEQKKRRGRKKIPKLIQDIEELQV